MLLRRAVLAVCSLSVAFAHQIPISVPHNLLIMPKTDAFVNNLIKEWNSTGLSVAVVRKV